MPPPPLILASASPRRGRILSMLGLAHDVEISGVSEAPAAGESPGARAERLARAKATAVSRRRPGALVLGGDTLVRLEGEVLGKPRDRPEARAMLRRLSGRTHEVVSGLALAAPSGAVHSGVSRTRVAMRALDPPEISAYAATGEPLDKAGAYGIQELGAALVARVEGDYFTVVGLPVPLLLRLFEAVGWRYRFGRLESSGDAS